MNMESCIEAPIQSHKEKVQFSSAMQELCMKKKRRSALEAVGRNEPPTGISVPSAGATTI